MDSILTITTPAENTDLITPADIIADLGIEDTGDNALFFDDIHSVSTAISGFIGRDMARVAYGETFREVNAQALILSRMPVAELVSVTEAGTVLTADQYEIDAAAGMIYRLSGDCRQCWRASKIVVAYKAGYLLPGDDDFQKGAAGSLPADIEKAAVIACRALYNTRGEDPMVKRESIPGVAEEERWVGTDPAQGASGLPTEVERLLGRYREVHIG